MRKVLLSLGFLLAADAKVGVWIDAWGGLGFLQAKDETSMFLFLQNTGKLDGAEKRANYRPELLHSEDGKMIFATNDGHHTGDSHAAESSGFYKLAFLSGSVDLFQMQNNTSFGFELGVGGAFGTVESKSKYAVIERSVSSPVVTAGPFMQYAFSKKISVAVGVFGALYEETYQTYLQRAELTDDYLSGLKNLEINKDVKLREKISKESVTQTFMAQEAINIFNAMDAKNKEANKFSTGYLLSFGAGASLNFNLAEDISAKIGVRYIFGRSATSKEGEKITKSHLIAASKSDLEADVLPSKVTLDRSGMLIISVSLSKKVW